MPTVIEKKKNISPLKAEKDILKIIINYNSLKLLKKKKREPFLKQIRTSVTS